MTKAALCVLISLTGVTFREDDADATLTEKGRLRVIISTCMIAKAHRVSISGRPYTQVTLSTGEPVYVMQRPADILNRATGQ